MTDRPTLPAGITPHDPGGKVRLPLQPGVRGRVAFSQCQRYRYWLAREWGDLVNPFALWIGMNPSTAAGDIDDPTIRKEMHFTRAMGLTTYVKVNVMDYRATNPADLLSVVPRSPDNLDFIIGQASGAARIICAWGALPKPLRRYADDVVVALRGFPLFCMGKTKSGAPRHPLYLPNNTECVPWP